MFFTVRFVTVTSVTHKPSLAPASLPGLFPYWPLPGLKLRRSSAPPSPPAEKTTARSDEAGKSSTGDGAGYCTPSRTTPGNSD